MKTPLVAFAIFLLQSCNIGSRASAETAYPQEIYGSVKIKDNEITWEEEMSHLLRSMRCSENRKLSVIEEPTGDKGEKIHFAVCCLQGQRLVGSRDIAWHCCAEGHDLAGSKETGYRCCQIGHKYNGTVCVKPDFCPNGKVLVNGKCVCPTGSAETSGGTCEPSTQTCSSGIETGKCYQFIGESGNKLVYDSNDNRYAESRYDGYNLPGKFQLCKDEACQAALAIDPGQGVYIKNLIGGPASQGGSRPNEWLNNKENGGHISKTARFAEAGQFTISKWPCGKYCVGGLKYGLGPACPMPSPALTFLTQDTQSCVPFELVEVPCDIKSTSNNCIWKKGRDQCCDKVDCSRA
ncbi:hypothetical protein HIM_00302 [Hirsutella minnesotensis 3608]|nr:hypothetical protein HIM_00302 [Hirsutella minnesotensis 3608]